jgi:hypothetical protein
VTAVLLAPEPTSPVLLDAEPMTFRLRSGACIPLPPGEWGLIAKEEGRSEIQGRRQDPL